jgi:serine phosphatase RsbU (regulator of sigma subunit)
MGASAAMTGALERSYAAALDGLLRGSHLMPPDALGELTDAAAARLGAQSATLWLTDYEQTSLVPLLPPEGAREVLSIDGSIAGRAFRTVTPVEVEVEGGRARRLWVPLLDGVERLGVLEVVLPTDTGPLGDELHRMLGQFAHLVAELLVSNSSYTDHYEWIRRQQPMNLPAEMQHALLPPLTFGTDRLVISGLLAPAYEVGGDVFDYALNGNIAHIALFDAVGHGLQASLLSNLAVNCYRNARRAGLDLAHSAVALDLALAEMFGGERFVTALLCQLDVDTGELRCINAGHPEAMLLRGTRVVKELQSVPAMPLGLNGLLHVVEPDSFPVLVEHLQPGDRLLLATDGVDEARDEHGEFFGRERLAEFAAKEAASGVPTPELMRRLQMAILRHQTGRLQDDATMLLVEWRTGREEQNAL